MPALVISEGLRAALLANEELTALVGQNVWLGFAPTDETAAAGPWIVLERISNDRESAHDGDQSLGRTRYQLTIGGTDPEKVQQVRDLLVANFNGVEYTHEENVLTFFHAGDDENFNEETRVFEASVDLFIWTT